MTAKSLATASVVLVVVAGAVLVWSLLELKHDKDQCEMFRFTAIQDVPARCFDFYRREAR